MANLTQRVVQLEEHIANLELALMHQPMPKPEIGEHSMYHTVRQQCCAASRQRYFETAGRATSEWDYCLTDCECGGDHRAIKFKEGKIWRRLCPIHYYILLAWQAHVKGCPVPTEELYWKLLGKEKPSRKEREEDDA